MWKRDEYRIHIAFRNFSVLSNLLYHKSLDFNKFNFQLQCPLFHGISLLVVLGLNSVLTEFHCEGN